MNLCSIRSPPRPARSGEGNQTRKKLNWKMPLPDSSPSLGEGKVFSSSSSPFYGRKGVAGRGMLHVKCASVAPEPYPRVSASRLPVTAPRTEHPQVLSLPLLPRVSPCPAEGPGRFPGPQRARQPPGVPAAPRFARRHRRAGTGAARRDTGDNGVTSWNRNVVPPTLPALAGSF